MAMAGRLDGSQWKGRVRGWAGSRGSCVLVAPAGSPPLEPLLSSISLISLSGTSSTHGHQTELACWGHSGQTLPPARRWALRTLPPHSAAGQPGGAALSWPWHCWICRAGLHMKVAGSGPPLAHSHCLCLYTPLGFFTCLWGPLAPLGSARLFLDWKAWRKVAAFSSLSRSAQMSCHLQ